MVPSEQSPSGWGSIRQWGVSGGPGVQSCRPVNFGRAPSEERRLRGREKELKAYIGCQEKTIQSLVEQLVEARKSIVSLWRTKMCGAALFDPLCVLYFDYLI